MCRGRCLLLLLSQMSQALTMSHDMALSHDS